MEEVVIAFNRVRLKLRSQKDRDYLRALKQLRGAQPTIGQDIGSSHPMAAPHSRNHGDVLEGGCGYHLLVGWPRRGWRATCRTLSRLALFDWCVDGISLSFTFTALYLHWAIFLLVIICKDCFFLYSHLTEDSFKPRFYWYYWCWCLALRKKKRANTKNHTDNDTENYETTTWKC